MTKWEQIYARAEAQLGAEWIVEYMATRPDHEMQAFAVTICECMLDYHVNKILPLMKEYNLATHAEFVALSKRIQRDPEHSTEILDEQRGG